MAVHSEEALSVKEQARNALVKSTEYWEQLNTLLEKLDEASLQECGKVAFYHVATAATGQPADKYPFDLRREMAEASEEERSKLEASVQAWRAENQGDYYFHFACGVCDWASAAYSDDAGEERVKLLFQLVTTANLYVRSFYAYRFGITTLAREGHHSLVEQVYQV